MKKMIIPALVGMLALGAFLGVYQACDVSTPKPNVTCTDGLCVSKDDFPITVHYESRIDLPPALSKCSSNTILVEKGGKVLCPRFAPAPEK